MSATATDPTLKYLTQAREQIARGDLRNATATLKKANALWPKDARVFMLGGLLAEKNGNIEGAFGSLRKAVSLWPDWGPGLLELALLLARQNQFKEAVETAEKVAVLEPNNLRVLASVVDIAHRAGHVEMAVRHLRRGLQLVPGDRTLSQYLARDLSGLGHHDEALALWDTLVAESPSDPHCLVGRIQACIAAGKPEKAQGNASVLFSQAPEDLVYQYYMQLTQGQTPAQQPAGLTKPLFDGLAQVYDMHVVRTLKYQLPKQVAEKVISKYPDKKINVLDMGCGTGLLGLYLGRLEGFLVGVDLSPKMVEQAARHGVYDRFHTVNLHDALRATPGDLYQVIAALDVFIYAGDIGQAVRDAYRILTPGGMLVFSFESADESGPDMVLLPSGRYAHKRIHVQTACETAGFNLVEVEETVLRTENHTPVHGFVVTATKTA